MHRTNRDCLFRHAEHHATRLVLRDVPAVRFEVQYAVTLAEALQSLTVGGMDVVLLDLSLPDSKGWVTFEKAHAARPDSMPARLLRR